MTRTHSSTLPLALLAVLAIVTPDVASGQATNDTLASGQVTTRRQAIAGLTFECVVQPASARSTSMWLSSDSTDGQGRFVCVGERRTLPNDRSRLLFRVLDEARVGPFAEVLCRTHQIRAAGRCAARVINIPPLQVVAARVDTVTITRMDTVVLSRVDTVTVTRVDTVTRLEELPIQPLPRFAAAIAAGAIVPLGAFSDAARIGTIVSGRVEWFPSDVLGLRAEVGAGRLPPVRTTCVSCPSTTLRFGGVDLLLRGALDRISLVRPIVYAFGGIGAHRFTDFVAYQTSDGTDITAGPDTYLPSVPAGATIGSQRTFFDVHVGAGASVALGRVSVFVESRYVSVGTEGARTSYVPIMLGLRLP
jgi:hypothetical protein